MSITLIHPVTIIDGHGGARRGSGKRGDLDQYRLPFGRVFTPRCWSSTATRSPSCRCYSAANGCGR